MSWFDYGRPKRRHLRKGVWLRVRCLPDPLRKQAREILKRDENIEWVEIKEVQPKNKVLLEFWCKRPFVPSDNVKRKKFPGFWSKWMVFHLSVDEDPEWVCEGDLGRGYKE